MGNLQFYGKQNGQKSGWAREYYRARDSKEANDDPFAIHLEDAEDLKKLYHDAEHVGEWSPPDGTPSLQTSHEKARRTRADRQTGTTEI
jgi:hypothetical protein